MMKQLQDAIRSYNEKNLNNYMTTAILCELFNQASGAAEEKGGQVQAGAAV